MFTVNSALVKLWIRYIENGDYTREQVPSLSNLKEMVFAILESR